MLKKLIPENTIVIADFDGTCTLKVVNGQKTPSLMAILASQAYLPPAAVKEAQDLFAHYYPIEIDPTVDAVQKNQLMKEWWIKSTDVLVRYEVTLKMIQEVTKSPLVQFRPQFTEFLHYLKMHEIPLIIYSSSGIGYDAITYLLKDRSLLSPNIKVFSNDTQFDKTGRMTGIAEPIIHIANKTGQNLVKNHLIMATPTRTDCLLLGDTLDDLRMSEGINFQRVYSVAFAAADHGYFEKLFTQVLPLDGGYQPILDLFED